MGPWGSGRTLLSLLWHILGITKNEALYIWPGAAHATIGSNWIHKSIPCNNRSLLYFIQFGQHLGKWRPKNLFWGHNSLDHGHDSAWAWPSMVNNINIQHFNALRNVTCAQIIELRSNGRRYGSWAYTWIWWPRFASLLCDFFRCWKKTDRWMDEQYHSIISSSMEGCTAFFQLTICYIINSRKTISVRASVWNIRQRHSHKIRVSFWSSRFTMALLIGCKLLLYLPSHVNCNASSA